MVSMIIPVYNAEPYLRRCLDSVLNSTYREFELILVNDGSTDNSPAICEEYAARDSRVTLISQENRGASAARNRGLEVCRGEWVVFVDADDLISPDFLGLVAREEYQDQDLLLFDFAQTEEDLTAAHPTPEVVRFGLEKIIEVLRGLILRQQFIENGNLNLVSPCGKAYRRTVIQQHAFRFDPDLSYGEDQCFNAEYLTKTRHCIYLAVPVYYYNIYHGSSSHRFDPRRIFEFGKLLTKTEAILRIGGFLPLLEETFISSVQEILAFFLLSVVFSPLNSNPFPEKRRLCLGARDIDVFLRASKYRPITGTWFYRFVKRILFFLFRTRQCGALQLAAWCSHMLMVLKNPEGLVERRNNGWLP